MALTAGYLTGAVGLAAGLTLSALFDLSTGPTVVTTMAASALAAAQLRAAESSASP